MIVGLYVHVPFCLSKCPYCDFYSVRYSREKAKEYADKVIRNIQYYSGQYDTVYFGGGTPVLIYEHIGDILKSADITKGAEITVEANPCAVTANIAKTLAAAGVNRVSLGVQSMSEKELGFLGRRHTPAQVNTAFTRLHEAGITNISADMMIGLPGQDEKSISETINGLHALGAVHISAYLLKIEDNTPFAKQNITLPDDERTAQLYLYTAKQLERLGYGQYEISNFAAAGYECKHNLKYWRCEQYIGIGAAAHSYYKGERFCAEPDIDRFLKSPVQQTVLTDSSAGGWEEYAMLKLRLTEGISFAEAEKYGKASVLREAAEKLPRHLVNITDSGISLTQEGFLVSNAVIGKIVF